MQKKIIFIFIYFFSFTYVVTAEMSFNSIIRDYQRTMELIGEKESKTLNYHTYSSELNFNKIESGPWGNLSIKDPIIKASLVSMNILSPEIWTSWNSTTAWGGNDGSLWQGKGFNSVLSGGFEINNPYFSIRLYPEIWGAQNLNLNIIDTASSSGYGDYWKVFDNLQSYGDEAYYDFSWGQSDIRFYLDKFTLGFSTESIVLGPGQITNIILSNNAGGFPHFDMGTSEKVKVPYIGDVEFRAIWGFLKESEFFDEDSSNDYGWISGAYFAWAPSFWNNFTMGFNYQYYKPLSEWDGWDLVRAIPGLDHSNSPTDNKDMMISLPFRWLFPSIGFEFYGEWARNDNFSNFEDLLNSPEHTQAYTLGINQILKQWDDNIVQLSLELSNLGQERTYEIRAAGPWYRHYWAGWTQGYTNNGQLPGASIGPGSNSQWGKISWLRPEGGSSISIQRIAHDKDYFYEIVKTDPDAEYFTEVNLGVDNIIFLNNFDLYSSLRSIFGYNNNFIWNKNTFNLHLELGLKYHL